MILTGTSGGVLGSVQRRRVDAVGAAACQWQDAQGRTHGAVVVRNGNRYAAFRNLCPHWGVPLAPPRGPFLEETTGLLRCSVHGARFRVRDGTCVDGPCPGAALEALAVTVYADRIDVHAPSPLRIGATLRKPDGV